MTQSHLHQQRLETFPDTTLTLLITTLHWLKYQEDKIFYQEYANIFTVFPKINSCKKLPINNVHYHEFTLYQSFWCIPWHLSKIKCFERKVLTFRNARWYRLQEPSVGGVWKFVLLHLTLILKMSEYIPHPSWNDCKILSSWLKLQLKVAKSWALVKAPTSHI